METIKILRKINYVFALEAEWYPNNMVTVKACRARRKELEEELKKQNDLVYSIYRTIFGLMFMILGKASKKEALGYDFQEFRKRYS